MVYLRCFCWRICRIGALGGCAVWYIFGEEISIIAVCGLCGAEGDPFLSYYYGLATHGGCPNPYHRGVMTIASWNGV